MRKITSDILFAWRMLFKKKLFAVVALATLGLCIGGNTFVFTILDSFVLRPLPYPESNRLVELYNTFPGYQHWRAASSFVNYEEYKEHVPAFEDHCFIAKTTVNVQKGDVPMSLRSHAVSPEFFRVLRVQPFLGRWLDEQDFKGTEFDTAVISYNLWNKLFKGDRNAIGETIKMNGIYHTIVGVMPEGFYYEETDVQVWTPYYINPFFLNEEFRHSVQINIFARIAEGYTIEDARAQLQQLNDENYTNITTKINRDAYDIGEFHTFIWPLKNRMSESYQKNLYLLQGGVLIMLMIGCVNISNLLMIRSNERMGEFAIRSAIGARKKMVLRLVLAESMIICVLGGVLGLLVGIGGILAFDNIYALRSVFNIELSIDYIVILFTLAVAVLAGFVCGGASLFNVWKGNQSEILKEDGGSATSSRFVNYMTTGLVVFQLALTFALSYSALLLFISFKNTLAADIGFEPKGLYNAIVDLTEEKYPEQADMVRVTDRLVDRILEIPGVEHVALARGAPFITNGIYLKKMEIKGAEDKNAVTRVLRGTEDMFATFGVDLVEGRLLKRTDTPENEIVAVIDTYTAKKYFPEGALDERIYIPNSGVPANSDGYVRIVGVVDHVKIRELDMLNEREKGIAYISHRQSPFRYTVINMRTELPELTLRNELQRAIFDVDPELPYYDLQPQQRRIDFLLFKRRMFMTTFVICSCLAIVLSVLGIFGLVSYSSTLRTKEIGIRMAIGAKRNAILKLMLGVGMKRILVGITLGVLTVMVSTKGIESFLFGVKSFDPFSLVAVSLWITAVGMLATYLPSRTAAKTQPITALRFK